LALSGELTGVAGPRWLRNWAGAAAIAAVFAITGILVAHLGLHAAKAHFGEDGTVEISTPVFYVLVAILYGAWRNRIGTRSIVPVLILLLMAWRELDGDRWFTEKSVISTGYYFDNPGVGYGQRILAAAILGPLGVVILGFFWEARHRILAAVRVFQPYCRSLLTAFAMLGASLILDGIGRKVYDLFGVQLSHAAIDFAGIVEETAELGMAVGFLVALLQLRFDPARNTLPRAAPAAVQASSARQALP